MTTIKQALNDARLALRSSSDSPSVDASVLLCHVLACAPAHLLAWPDRTLTSDQQSQFGMLLQQRLQGHPVAYIVGQKEFWSLALQVSPDVLIPRPETETLVEFVLDRFSAEETLDVADLGTGSGAIACAIASERPRWNIIATDASPAALEIAQTNAASNRLENIAFRLGHWFEPIADMTFDLIISNPPYVAEDDPHLDQGDVRFEPEGALAAGRQGMDAIRHLARHAGRHLGNGGWLIVEHGFDQQQIVYDCFAQSGYEDIIQLSDLAGQPRMTAGRYVKSGT